MSYILDGPATGQGTTFVCVPGRLDGRPPPVGAPRGEIVEWCPEQRVVTRLELTPEVWTTTIDFADAGGGGTQIAITLTHEPCGGGSARQRLQRAGLQRMMRRTVDAELAKIPDHIDQADHRADESSGQNSDRLGDRPEL
ncbi:SRPBCC family protein [Modestobacter sp. DSM 44400]|uniref:SRPBCC family protein n=1 Tax=Modestobacter sp. DSM 44400 TaxID=1550230 RepID=UPI0020C8DB72|nr:SRPBCC family protein [Modestobacter sp. DSM 44400]